MKFRIAVFSLALLLPGLAFAEGCHSRTTETTAMSCMAGTSWDAEKGVCVPKPSS